MAHAHRALAPGATAAALLGATMVSGCASAPHPAQATGPSPAPAAAASPAGFYDWRGLVPVPFGTLLKDMPIALTEVLMFRDPAGGDHGHDDGDCYTPAGISPPPFLGHRPDDYLLCFEHDRLSRIHASVGISASDAPALLAAACEQWQRGAPAAATRGAEGCEGNDGTTEFSARLIAGEPVPEVDTAGVATLAFTLHDHRP